MNNRRNYLLTTLAVLLLVFCAVLFAYSNNGSEKERYKILVLVDENGADRWTILKQGLDRGAVDYNMEVSFQTVSDSLYSNEQAAVINREIQNGIDGMILDAVSSKSLVNIVDNTAGQIPVVLIETDILSDTIYPCMRPDNYQMGKDLGESVAKEVEPNQKIGILWRSQEKNSYSERYQGVTEALEKHGVKIDWQVEKTSASTIEKVNEALEEGDEHIIVCLGNSDAEEIIDYTALTDKKIKIFTIGNTEKVVYYLDKGLVDTLVVPNEFNMAYLAVQEISKQLEYKAAGGGQVIEHTVVNKDNMYDRDIQKLLFPIVQ